MKISIIGGGGLVGSMTAFALQCGGVFSDICLIDANKDMAEGQATDLLHGASLVADQRIRAGDMGDVASSHVVGGTDSQDYDANNLLANFVDLTVAYDRSAQGLSPLFGTASVPITSIVVFAAGSAAQGFGGGVSDPTGIVDAEYARLAALAGA